MKIIDQAKEKGARKASAVFSKVFRKGVSKAQAVAKESLGIILNDKFYLICNTVFRGLDVPIPLILAGPTGLWVINPSDTKGVFRAKETVWEELNSRSGNYHLAQHNPINLTTMMARAVNKHLTRQGIALPNIMPVLFFVEPGVHVEATRPAVRIVLVDAIDRFASGVAQSEVVLEEEDVKKILLALGTSATGESLGSLVAEPRDAFSFQDRKTSARTQRRPINVDIPLGEPEIAKKVPFKPRQWVILGILLLVNIIIIVALVLLVLRPV